MKLKNVNKIVITILLVLLSFNITVRVEALKNEYQTFYSEGVKLEIVSKNLKKDTLKLKCRVSNMSDSEIYVLGNKFYILDSEQNDLDIKISKKFNVESFLFNQIIIKPNDSESFKITLENINNKDSYILKGKIRKSNDSTSSSTANVDINFNLDKEI